jgi:AraC-like DNA-binding protein
MDINAYVKQVEEVGMLVVLEAQGFTVRDVDLVFPYTVMTLCLKGHAHALYDMQEITQHKNELGLILPGHILRPLGCSDDYTFARIVVSPKMFQDLRFYAFSHDYEKFHYAPMCTLTDKQTERLMTIIEHLDAISKHSLEELPHRYELMLTQLAIGYEVLNFYRREQDKNWSNNKNTFLFHQFCEAVVAHYTESKEIQFYARMFNLTPKYFSQIIKEASGGTSPGDWIEQYVITQAKRLIKTSPGTTLKEIAFMLGFNEPTTFYRYFKHATGITAKQYRNSCHS